MFGLWPFWLATTITAWIVFCHSAVRAREVTNVECTIVAALGPLPQTAALVTTAYFFAGGEPTAELARQWIDRALPVLLLGSVILTIWHICWSVANLVSNDWAKYQSAACIPSTLLGCCVLAALVPMG